MNCDLMIVMIVSLSFVFLVPVSKPRDTANMAAIYGTLTDNAINDFFFNLIVQRCKYNSFVDAANCKYSA